VTLLQAIYDEEIAGGILVTDVPGAKKVVPEGLRGAFRVVPVTEHCLQARPVGTTPIVAWHEVPGRASLERTVP
jgi:hypothetical protein